jgi:hypothetical protein
MAYPQYSQVVALSFLTNVTNGVKATPQQLQQQATDKTYQVLADPEIKELVGEWHIEWGPVIFCVNNTGLPTYTNNAMLVTRKDNTYLVTVAGTNGKSLYDWFIEDFAVGDKVAWDSNDSNKGHIARGTNITLEHHLNMRDPVTKRTLLEFLQSVTIPVEQLIVAGHSLGGTLTPALALKLENEKLQWGGECATIYAYPTAGATPGDKTFAKYFRSVFAGDRYNAWKNRLDVVPHAWQESTLAEVPGLYKPNIKPDTVIYALLAYAEGKSLLKHYKQIEGQHVFPSEFHCDTSKPPPKLVVLQFLDQLAWQHIDAYYKHFEIERFIEIVFSKGDVPDVSHDTEALFNKLSWPKTVAKAIQDLVD